MKSNGLTLCIALFCALGCSGAESNGGTGGSVNSSSGGGGGVATSTGGVGGVNGASGGSTSGGSTSAGAGSGGQGALSCKGQFGEARLHFTAPAGEELSSPTVSADQLELIYGVSGNVRTTWRLMRSQRASKSEVFGAGSPIVELDSACATSQRRTGGLSSDGLRFYYLCYDTAADSAALHVARRSARGAAFTIDAMTYGTTGPSPFISRDELELLSTKPTDPNTDAQGLVRYTRSSREQAFGAAQPILGLETIDASTPALSPDGLELFMYTSVGIMAAYRASASDAFGVPVAFTTLSTVAKNIFGSPEVSQDCHDVYVIHVDYTVSTTSVFSMMSASR